MATLQVSDATASGQKLHAFTLNNLGGSSLPGFGQIVRNVLGALRRMRALPTFLMLLSCTQMTLTAAEPIVTHARIIHAHDSWVACLAFSPDSQVIASGGGRDASLRGYGELKLFEAGTGKQLRHFRDYETTVRAVAFASDGKSIAGGGYPVIVWNLPEGTKRLKIKPSDSLLSLAYLTSQDQLVTTSMGKKEATVWDTKRGRRLTTLDGDTAPAAGNTWSLSVPKDGTLLVTGGNDRRAVIWNCKDWTLTRLIGSPDEAKVVRLNSDGTALFTKGDPSFPGRLWYVRDGTLKCQLVDDDWLIGDAAFSPDGKLLATVGFEGLRVWDAETGKLLEQKRGDNSSVAFSPDGQLLAVGSNQGMIVVYGVKKCLGDDAQKQETAKPIKGNQ